MSDATTVAIEPPAEDAARPHPDTSLPRPRVRWAGIVWGLLLAALATAGLVTIGSADTRRAIHDALLRLDPATIDPGYVVGAAVLGVGVLLLVLGVLALVRRGQHGGTAS